MQSLLVACGIRVKAYWLPVGEGDFIQAKASLGSPSSIMYSLAMLAAWSCPAAQIALLRPLAASLHQVLMTNHPHLALAGRCGLHLGALGGRGGLLLCCRAPAALCIRPAHAFLLLRTSPGARLPG